MQGRGIVQEIVRIRSELNCMHKYYSILHHTSLGKVEVLLHNSNIYIYIFVQVNMMTTWYFNMTLTGRSRLIIEIYHSCFLPQWKLCHVQKIIAIIIRQHTFCKIIMSISIILSTCFDWVWISTTIGIWHMYWINYKLQVPKWIVIKSDEISVKHCKMKVQVYHCSSHLYMLKISETDLVLWNTIFSLVCCIRLEWCTSTAMYCVTMSPHFSSKQFCRLCVPNVWQRLETVNSEVMKLLLLHWIIEYMTVNESLWKYCISITYTFSYCWFNWSIVVISGTVHRLLLKTSFHPLLWTSSGLTGSWKTKHLY